MGKILFNFAKISLVFNFLFISLQISIYHWISRGSDLTTGALNRNKKRSRRIGLKGYYVLTTSSLNRKIIHITSPQMRSVRLGKASPSLYMVHHMSSLSTIISRKEFRWYLPYGSFKCFFMLHVITSEHLKLSMIEKNIFIQSWEILLHIPKMI